MRIHSIWNPFYLCLSKVRAALGRCCLANRRPVAAALLMTLLATVSHADPGCPSLLTNALVEIEDLARFYIEIERGANNRDPIATAALLEEAQMRHQEMSHRANSASQFQEAFERSLARQRSDAATTKAKRESKKRVEMEEELGLHQIDYTVASIKQPDGNPVTHAIHLKTSDHFVAADSSGRVQIRSSKDGRVLKSLPETIDVSGQERLVNLSLSHNERILTALYFPGSIRQWDLTTNALVDHPDVEFNFNTTSFVNSKNDTVVTAHLGRVDIVSIISNSAWTGFNLAAVKTPGKTFAHFAIDKDDIRYVTPFRKQHDASDRLKITRATVGPSGTQTGIAKVLSETELELPIWLNRISGGLEITSYAWSSRGDTLHACFTNKPLHLEKAFCGAWDTQTGKLKFYFGKISSSESMFTRLRLDEDGRRIYAGGYNIPTSIFRADTGELIQAIDGFKSANLTDIAFNALGQSLFTFSASGDQRMYTAKEKSIP